MKIPSAEQLLKKDKPSDTVDVEIQYSEQKAPLNPDSGDEEVPYKPTTYPVIIGQRRVEKQKRRCCLQLCLFIGMILGLTLCVLGSVFLYRDIYYVKYNGKFGVKFIDMGGDYVFNETDYMYELPTPSAVRQKPSNRGDIEEEIDINGNVETLKTPSQYNASAATFRHDFDRNMTAVRDMLNDFCYFIPFINAFSNGMIPSPRDFSFFLENKQPDDSPQVLEQHEYFERKDPVTDSLSLFGSALSEICDGTSMWTAEPRSFDDYDYATTQAMYQETTMSPFYSIDQIFRMYPGGDDIYTYHIYTIEL